MAKKNVGGQARKVELILAELEERLERVQMTGFEMGLEAAERLGRVQPNDCPMCDLRGGTLTAPVSHTAPGEGQQWAIAHNPRYVNLAWPTCPEPSSCPVF